MIPSPKRACFAIADVSGYTGYLAGVELDHAQDILADLISTIVGAMGPFRLSKLEGDAAFTYLPGESIDGSVLQDTIESTYIAFRSRLRNIQQATTCPCDACTRIPTLDLKFVVHAGEVAFQQMLGTEELVGADVILVHRLLKNGVVGATGINAYALYTDAALRAAGIDPADGALTRHVETVDVAGEVITWIRDLEAHWQAELARPRREIPTERLLWELVWEVPTTPAVTWEWLTSPAKRPLWDTSLIVFEEETVDGRRGIGTTNHCVHGEAAVRENILDWRPPHYWLMQGFLSSVPGEPGLLIGDELELTADGGTLVRTRVGAMESYAPEAPAVEELLESLREGTMANNERLQQQLRAVAQASATQALEESV